jgi:hypothetical protein
MFLQLLPNKFSWGKSNAATTHATGTPAKDRWIVRGYQGVLGGNLAILRDALMPTHAISPEDLS